MNYNNSKTRVNVLILLYAFLQLVVFGVTYQKKAPKEFAHMLYEATTSNSIRLAIIVIGILILVASLIIVLIFGYIFRLICKKVYPTLDYHAYYDLESSFVCFLNISGIQPFISLFTNLPRFFPIMPLLATAYLGYALIRKTEHILSSILIAGSLLLLSFAFLIATM